MSKITLKILAVDEKVRPLIFSGFEDCCPLQLLIIHLEFHLDPVQGQCTNLPSVGEGGVFSSKHF